MYATVENWARRQSNLDYRLSSESVRHGRNLNETSEGGHSHGPRPTGAQYHLPGGFNIPAIPNVQSIENTFTASLNQNFGGIMRPLSKLSGLTREGDFESEIEPGAYNQPAYREPLGGGRTYEEQVYEPPQGPPPPHQQQFGYGPDGGFHEEFQGSYGQYQAREPTPWESRDGYGGRW